MKSIEINRYIDHTLLKPEATENQIINLCQEAKDHHFFSVCINPFYVSLAKNQLKNSDVKVCTVVGFPLGTSTTEVKVFETLNAIKNGADEIDMVINIGMIKNQNWIGVQEDIAQVVNVAKENQKIVKVIFETCLLTKEEIYRACQASAGAGARFVKTSTGFSTGGATLEDVILMKKNILPEMEVKASGGVRDLESAKKFIEAGATRLGSSSGVSIMKGVISSSSY